MQHRDVKETDIMKEWYKTMQQVLWTTELVGKRQSSVKTRENVDGQLPTRPVVSFLA